MEVKKKRVLLEIDPYATRDAQLRKLVAATDWNTLQEGLELSEVRHRMYFSIWYTAKKIGLELRKSEKGVWFIRAFDESTGVIRWQRLTLKRAKPYVLEIAYQKGLMDYINNNQIIVEILSRVYNRQMILCT